MDVYILDDTFRKQTVVDDFDSIIWAERFNEIGDFELVTADNVRNRGIFGRGARIMIDKSDRVMQIERMTASQDEQNVRKLTVKGRSIEKVLMGRLCWRSSSGLVDPQSPWTLIFTPVELMNYFINRVLIAGSHDTNNDPLPNLSTSRVGYPADGIPAPADPVSWVVPGPRTMWEELHQIMTTYSLGYRMYANGTNGLVYSNPYTGTDRSNTQTSNTPVIFSTALDNISSMTSIDSIEPSVTAVSVYSSYGGTSVFQDASYGWDRVWVPLEVSEPEDLPTDQRTQYRQARGKAYLNNHVPVFALDGEVSKVSQYVYNQDYYLGDLVSLEDEYGNSNKMRVVEQIFSQDEKGEQAYPSFKTELIITSDSWLGYDPAVVWPDAPGMWEEQ